MLFANIRVKTERKYADDPNGYILNSLITSQLSSVLLAWSVMALSADSLLDGFNEAFEFLNYDLIIEYADQYILREDTCWLHKWSLSDE